jgi:translation initiation factor IF-3
VIGEEGENLDVMLLAAALELAKQKGLDLIEISASARPPVARIMSFDKFRYQEEKKFKKQRASQKSGGIKQVQVGVRTAGNDLQLKSKKVNEFLNEGYRVEILLVVRGREKAHKDFAMEKMKNFLTMLDPAHKVTGRPQFVMKGISIQVTK